MGDMADTLRNAQEGQTLHLETSGPTIDGVVTDPPEEIDPDPDARTPQVFDKRVTLTLADDSEGDYDEWEITLTKIGGEWQPPTVSGASQNGDALTVGSTETVEDAEVA